MLCIEISVIIAWEMNKSFPSHFTAHPKQLHLCSNPNFHFFLHLCFSEKSNKLGITTTDFKWESVKLQVFLKEEFQLINVQGMRKIENNLEHHNNHSSKQDLPIDAKING